MKEKSQKETVMLSDNDNDTMYGRSEGPFFLSVGLLFRDWLGRVMEEEIASFGYTYDVTNYRHRSFIEERIKTG